MRIKSDTMLYVCTHYPQCDHLCAHPSGNNDPCGDAGQPSAAGRCATRRTAILISCITAADDKQEAYLWLAGLLQAPLSQAHIGYLGSITARQVIEESKKLLERHTGNLSHLLSLL